MAGYIGSKASVVSSGAERKKTFAITTTTTALTGLVYTPTKVHVFHNGVRLVDGTDFTATNSTSITLTVAAESGDQVVVVSYATFQTSDTVSASAGGTFAGNVAFGANATFGDNDKAVFGAGSDLQIYHDGSHSYISDLGTGPLRITTDGTGILLNKGTSESMGRFLIDGAVELFHNNVKKIETTATGINVAGQATLTSGQLNFAGSISDPNGAAYIWRPADNTLAFGTANEERMRITAAGNVGIGTAVPETTLEIKSTGTSIAGLKGHILVSDETAVAANVGGGVLLEGNYTTAGDDAVFGAIKGLKENGTSGNYAGALAFYSRPHGGLATERMRIDSSGHLLVGKTSANNTDVGTTIYSTLGFSSTRSGGVVGILNRTTNDGDIMQFRKSGTAVGSIGNFSTTVVYLAGNANGLKIVAPAAGVDAFGPSTTTGGNRDNTMDIGWSSNRFDDIFATNGTIQTSDRNEKQDVAALTATEMLVAARISGLFKTFRWIDSVADKGDNARTHTGVIAQDVQSAFIAEGLDSGDYALFTSATWWETQTDVAAVEADEDNEIEAADAYTRTDTFDTLDEAPDGATERTRMGIRYPELLAFVGSYNEQRFASIETRLAALEGN